MGEFPLDSDTLTCHTSTVTRKSTPHGWSRRGHDAKGVSLTQWQNSTRSEATQQYVAILERDPCSYCGAPADTNQHGHSHIDHIHPQYYGGVDWGVNMTATCRSCNSSKSTATLLGFLTWRLYARERVEAQAVLAHSNRCRKLGL